jgi:hypothetical protein
LATVTALKSEKKCRHVLRINEQKLETQQGVIRVLVKKFVPQTMPTGSPPCLLKQLRTSYS